MSCVTIDGVKLRALVLAVLDDGGLLPVAPPNSLNSQMPTPLTTAPLPVHKLKKD